MATTIYQTQQADGTPNFSDQQAANARPLIFAPLQPTNTSQPLPMPSQTPDNLHAVATAQAVYTALTVISPTPEMTVHSNAGDVLVTVALNPALRSDDKLQIVMDGKVVVTQKSTTPVMLSAMEPGTHVLLVQILDDSGQVIKTSPSVTFYLHHAKSHRSS